MTGIELITVEQLFVGFGAAFAALGGIAGVSIAASAVRRWVARPAAAPPAIAQRRVTTRRRSRGVA